MRWNAYIEQIKSLGYSGDGEDLREVQTWLAAKGYDNEEAEDDDGTVYQLADLHADRRGKRLNVSDAKRASDVEELANQKLAELIDAGVVKTGPTISGKAHRHDVKVGRDNLGDDPKGGFVHAGDFYKNVRESCVAGQRTEKMDRYVKAATTYSAEDVGADGGFAVPTEFRNEIMNRLSSEQSLMGRTMQMPLSTNAVQIPVSEVPDWDNSTGISVNWEGEGQAQTQSKVRLELREWRLRKITALCPVTEELLDDASAIGFYLNTYAPRKIAFNIDDRIVNGTGTGQPEGILNAGCKIAVAKETNQDATTVVASNVIKMWNRLYGPYRANAVWLMNQDVEYELHTMSLPGKDNTGTFTSSYGQPVYMPANGLSGSPYATLFGRPVIPHQACQTLGTEGDIILWAPDEYLTATKAGGIEAAQSMHVWFDQDVVAYKYRMRVDGHPLLRSAISPKNGSNTYSSVVTVATRS